MALLQRQSKGALDGRVILAVLLVIPLVSVTFYFREGELGPLHRVQNTVSGLIAPFKAVGGGIGAAETQAQVALSDAAAEEATLSSLRAQNRELREELAKLEEYRQESQRLAGLLDLKDSYGFESVAGRIIGRSANPWEQVVTIDKGSRDGLIPGLTVLGPSGVIGQVIATSSSSSEVRLLGDPQSGVAVLVQSNRAEGIVRGSLEGLLYLEDVSNDSPVQVGDVIVTSGLGGSYARGLIVGMVVKVDENQGGATRTIVVAPNESASPLQDVLVVIWMASEGEAAVNTLVGPPTDEEGAS